MTPDFPPIGDYAFLSDCETTALVAPDGSVEWLCVPRMDAPSVFAAILDRAAGAFRLGPAGLRVPAARRYLPGTLVLETTWMTAGGWLLVRDCLAFRPGESSEPTPDNPRTPRGAVAARMLVRVATCLRGAVDMELMCEPALDYGRLMGAWAPSAGGARCEHGASDVALDLMTDLPLELSGADARGSTTLHDGESAHAVLSWDGLPKWPGTGNPPELVDRTESYWREWLGRGRFPDHPWRTHLQRSALVLKGLDHAPTGALAAAATTSLPEEIGGERNWDYRYTWIRDATFILWALYTLGLDSEADDFFAFIADRCTDEKPLQIMYGLGGERVLDEASLQHLTGYRGSHPVRIGNAAYDQSQHDVWGMLLDSIWLHLRSGRGLPDRLWPLVQRYVDEALANWRNPDRGIWEVRSPARHFTSSKVLCWVAADRGARLARLRGDGACADRWSTSAAEIHAEVCARAVDERGVFTQHYDTDALDASNLLLPLLRFLPPDDFRIRRTVEAIADELTDDDLVLRYRLDETEDGAPGTEGTFTICSFWLVSALVEIGALDRARELCDKLLSYGGALGLYAEQLEAHSGRHLGNFPQAFSHLALVNAVMHVIRAEAGREPGRFAPVAGEE